MTLAPLHIIKQTNVVHSAAVILLHGSGDTGRGFVDWFKFLIPNFSQPHIKFYFPTAPLQPYIPLGGGKSNVWFDRYDITPEVPEHEESLNKIKAEINRLIVDIQSEGIPQNRIVIGGFSMGGALALHTAYRFSPGFAGAFTLSSFLNKDSLVLKELSDMGKKTPLYMCHGDRDTMVPIEWGQKTYQDLVSAGISANFLPIKNTMHELKKSEIQGLLSWLQEILPKLETD